MTATSVEPLGVAGFKRILHVLFRIGSAISGRLGQKTQAAMEAGTSWREASVAYGRVARAIRRIVMLAMEISAPGYGAATGPRCEEGRGESQDALDRLDCEDELDRPDRIDRRDVAYNLTDKGMDGVIREICHDLGLPPLDTTHPWTELTVEEVARLVIDAVALLIKRAASRSKAAMLWYPVAPPPAGDAPEPVPQIHDG